MSWNPRWIKSTLFSEEVRELRLMIFTMRIVSSCAKHLDIWPEEFWVWYLESGYNLCHFIGFVPKRTVSKGCLESSKHQKRGPWGSDNHRISVQDLMKSWPSLPFVLSRPREATFRESLFPAVSNQLRECSQEIRDIKQKQVKESKCRDLHQWIRIRKSQLKWAEGMKSTCHWTDYHWGHVQM